MELCEVIQWSFVKSHSLWCLFETDTKISYEIEAPYVLVPAGFTDSMESISSRPSCRNFFDDITCLLRPCLPISCLPMPVCSAHSLTSTAKANLSNELMTFSLGSHCYSLWDSKPLIGQSYEMLLSLPRNHVCRDVKRLRKDHILSWRKLSIQVGA